MGVMTPIHVLLMVMLSLLASPMYEACDEWRTRPGLHREGSNGGSARSPNGYNRWSSRTKTTRLIVVTYNIGDPGRCADKDTEPPGYLVGVISLVPHVTLMPPNVPGDDSNEGALKVPCDMSYPCGAIRRQFPDKQHLSVATTRHPSKERTATLSTHASIPCGGEPMVPPTRNPMVPLTGDPERTSQLSTSERLQRQARHHVDERSTVHVNVPSHDLCLPAASLCRERTLDDIARCPSPPINECPSDRTQDPANEQKIQVSDSAQHTEQLHGAYRQDAQPAFTQGPDHAGAAAPKMTANDTNAQLHWAVLANPPSYPRGNCIARGQPLVHVELKNIKAAASTRTRNEGLSAHHVQANNTPPRNEHIGQ